MRLQSRGANVKRVLIVEDNPHLARLCKAALRHSGFEAHVAINGLDALDQVRQDIPDVIVLDVAMPIMDGREFFREIQTMPWRPPVLVMSAWQPHEVCRELGAEASIAKPFEIADLIWQVESLAG